MTNKLQRLRDRFVALRDTGKRECDYDVDRYVYLLHNNMVDFASAVMELLDEQWTEECVEKKP